MNSESFKQYVLDLQDSKEVNPTTKYHVDFIISELTSDATAFLFKQKELHGMPFLELYPVKTFSELESDLMEWIDTCIFAGFGSLFYGWFLLNLHRQWNPFADVYHDDVAQWLVTQRVNYGYAIPRNHIDFATNHKSIFD